MKIYKNKVAQKNIQDTYDALLAAWNVLIEPIDVVTRYGTTRVNVFGKVNAEPLFLFHGVGDDSAIMWIYNAAALSEHFRVYAVDTIGGPGKSVPNSNYNKTFDDAIWIDELLDFFELDCVNIAGVSHGGYLTQYYTLLRSHRVKKAMCLASNVLGCGGENTFVTMMKVLFPEALFPTKKNIKKLLKKLSGTNSAAFTDHPLIMDHFSFVLRGYNNMAMGAHKIIAFTDREIVSIKEKCLFLIGEEDLYAKYGGKAMQDQYQMNTLYFPNVGHGINHEIPDTINKLMIDYFTQTKIIKDCN